MPKDFRKRREHAHKSGGVRRDTDSVARPNTTPRRKREPAMVGDGSGEGGAAEAGVGTSRGFLGKRD